MGITKIKTAGVPDLIGKVFQRWTVIGDCIYTDRGERKWLCRCECGTERYVLERMLKGGGSKSCGCLRKERFSDAVAYNLTGQVFGNLTVLGKSDRKRRNSGIWWKCRCSCGKEYEVLATLLVTGKRTHCGCKTEKTTTAKDITGQKFSRLTALYPTEGRDAGGYIIWHCRCDCGNELDVSYNVLMYTGIKSCGCQKKEHDRKLNGFLAHVDGTSVDRLRSTKIPVNNTTGVKGVYFIRGKYVAKIVFQRKQYFLGTYKTLEEAAFVRREVEEHLNDTVVSCYELWKKKADADPQWAKEHPMQILVERNQNSQLTVRCLPEKEEMTNI